MKLTIVLSMALVLMAAAEAMETRELEERDMGEKSKNCCSYTSYNRLPLMIE